MIIVRIAVSQIAGESNLSGPDGSKIHLVQVVLAAWVATDTVGALAATAGQAKDQAWDR